MFLDNCKSPLMEHFNYLHPWPLAWRGGAQLHRKSNYFLASSSAAFHALRVFLVLIFAVINQGPPVWITALGVFANATDSALARCFFLLDMQATSFSFSLLLTFSAPSLPVISKL